jgi:hypothetical protein
VKASEIRPCALCQKPLMHTRLPLFYRVTVERMTIDLKAVRERHGIEVLLGSAPLAEVFAPTTEIANPLFQAATILVCERCAIEPFCVAVLDEVAQRTLTPPAVPA